MKVSIIIPIYNVESYIIECLESVFSQTYKDIEVIVVDDCGTDNSMLLVQQFVSTHDSSTFIIIHHDKNKGVSAARNTGIKAATGEYLYFLDSDDYLTSDCIESFVSLAMKYNRPDGVFGSATQFPWNWTLSCTTTDKPNIPEYTDNISWIRKSLKEDLINLLPITPWNKLVRKDFIITNNLYFKEGIIHEDNLWNWHLAKHLKDIAFNKKSTYYYRYSPTSIMGKGYGIKNMDSEVIIIKEYTKSLSFSFFISELIYILHFNHSSYCRRYGDRKLPPAFIRYPKAFLFFFKCLFMKPEQLRFIKN